MAREVDSSVSGVGIAGAGLVDVVVVVAGIGGAFEWVDAVAADFVVVEVISCLKNNQKILRSELFLMIVMLAAGN